MQQMPERRSHEPGWGPIDEVVRALIVMTCDTRALDAYHDDLTNDAMYGGRKKAARLAEDIREWYGTWNAKRERATAAVMGAAAQLREHNFAPKLLHRAIADLTSIYGPPVGLRNGELLGDHLRRPDGPLHPKPRSEHDDRIIEETLRTLERWIVDLKLLADAEYFTLATDASSELSRTEVGSIGLPTMTDLVEAVGISADKFRRIRSDARIPLTDDGHKASGPEYSPGEVDQLIQAVLNSNRHERLKIAEAWKMWSSKYAADRPHDRK